MEDYEFYRLCIALDLLSSAADTDMIDVVEALVGVCYDEEVAGDVKNFIAREG